MSMDTEEMLEFGIKKENEERRDGGCAIVFDPVSQKYAVGEERDSGLFRLFSGGVNPHEDIQTGVLREVVEESGLYDFSYIEKIATAWTHFYNSLRKVNRLALATCFLVILKSTDLHEVQLEEHETLTLKWVSASEIFSNWEARNQNNDLDHWVYFLKKSLVRAKELGYDTVSPPFS